MTATPVNTIPGSDALEWDSDALRDIRQAMLSPRSLAALRRRRKRDWILPMLIDMLVILLIAVVTELLFSWWLYGLAILVIGGRQVGIASIALHDGAHRFLVRDAALNQRIGTVILTLLTVPLLGIDIGGYRGGHHFDHHRFLLRDNDPENELFANLHKHGRTGTALNFLLVTLLTLSGLAYLLAMGKQLLTGAWCIRAAIIMLAAFCAAGLYYELRLVELLLLYWLIPLATWGLFINTVRAMAEHYPANAYGDAFPLPQTLRTRDVVPSLFDKLFVTTRNVNLHLSHHLYPAVPFYNLDKLHGAIRETDAYRHVAHETRGYHRFLWEYLVARFRKLPAA